MWHQVSCRPQLVGLLVSLVLLCEGGVFAVFGVWWVFGVFEGGAYCLVSCRPQHVQ